MSTMPMRLVRVMVQMSLRVAAVVAVRLVQLRPPPVPPPLLPLLRLLLPRRLHKRVTLVSRQHILRLVMTMRVLRLRMLVLLL